ncbi:MAG: heavy metal-responsive transcriptional regulator [Actinomycetota bacterium]
MQIGEIARRVGLATSAIRFYEEKGLLPEPERTASGYRDYDPSVVDRLQFIRAGQAVGLTLRELSQVLDIRDRGEPPCRHVAELLDDKISEVDQRISDLRGLRRDLVGLREHADALDPAECPPQSVCEILNVSG